MKKSQENDEEQKWDKLLQIHTTGRDDSNSDQYDIHMNRRHIRC